MLVLFRKLVILECRVSVLILILYKSIVPVPGGSPLEATLT